MNETIKFFGALNEILKAKFAFYVRIERNESIGAYEVVYLSATAINPQFKVRCVLFQTKDEMEAKQFCKFHRLTIAK